MLNECCKDLSNRKMEERHTLPTPVGSEKKDVAYREICKVCNRNHYGIEAVPMELKLKVEVKHGG